MRRLALISTLIVGLASMATPVAAAPAAFGTPHGPIAIAVDAFSALMADWMNRIVDLRQDGARDLLSKTGSGMDPDGSPQQTSGLPDKDPPPPPGR